MHRRLHLLVLPVAAFVAVLPLLLRGCSCGHDFDFHLVSWLDAARQITNGNLHPHWAYAPAYDAGEPRFIFYPPLSWTIGAVLTLLLEYLPHIAPDRAFALVPILYTWIALSAAGLGMHTLLRRYTSQAVAVVGAVLYLSNPYTLFTAYERTAYAELLAAGWMPLLLLAILPHPARCGPKPGSDSPIAPPVVSIPLLAVSIALLWVTNAPAAVMGCYAVALTAFLLLGSVYRRDRTPRALLVPAMHFVAGTSLGLALAAFYIVPAAYERRWVQIAMVTTPGMRIADNTLFRHTSDPAHDAVLHTVSIMATLLLSATALALLSAFRRKKQPKPPDALLPLLAILTGTIAFLLTPLALPLWHHAPELAFLQFPWRLLAILAVILPLALALALRAFPFRLPAIVAISFLTAASMSYGAFTAFQQSCDPDETPQAQFALFHSGAGTEPTDEYTPITADNDSLRQSNSPFTLTSPASGNRPSPGPAPSHLDLNLQAPVQIVLNLRDYPAWLITRNGLPVTERLGRDDGLIAFNLPAGHSHIDVAYRTTRDQYIGDAISIFALCIFVPLSFSAYRRRRTPPANAQVAR